MAIYHFSVKDIGRGKGRSAVACSAYRSGEKLNCERYGLEQDYTKKQGVEFKKIYAPENAKKELLDRQSLWNEVERVEKRVNSNLAREFEIAFPHELNAEQRQEMLDELCQKIVDRHNVVVDAVIHAPHTKGGTDERNYHAHIMFTGRQLDRKTGDFAKNRNRDFNKEKSSETVTQWRKEFADIVNRQLERIGCDERVSHLSYKDLKYDLEPTIHEGAKVTELRRQGIDTEISLANDAIRERNAERQLIKGLEQEIIATERLVQDLKRQKEKPRINPLRQAQMDIQAFNSAVEDRARKLAMNADQKQYDQVKQSLEIVQRERNNLEMQMQNMGKRPMFIGAKDWDAKHDRLKADWHRTNEREKELKGDIQKADPARFKDLARRDVERDQPELKDKFDKATALRDQTIQQRQEPGQNKDQDKQAERQARLDAARAIGEAEKANKAQLDKERAERAEQERRYRMR
ncbi:MobA/MobL family protein [Acinetobacter baumannii]|nr:MobA/MobL family protein [Acinetobacter baumannii]